MAGQPGFFDLSDRCETLSAAADPLERLGHAPTMAMSISVATRFIGKVEWSYHTSHAHRGVDPDDRLPLAELMAKTGDGGFLCMIAESVLQIIMEADVDGRVGAGRPERSGDRTTWRNSYRDRSLDTRLGTLNIKIPKLQTGAYFPGFLGPRKTVEKALVAVIQEVSHRTGRPHCCA